VRRFAGVVLVLLVACTGSKNPTPATVSSPIATVETSSPTTAPSSIPTTRFTSPVITGPTTAPTSATGDALDRLDAAITAIVPDYEEIAAAAHAVLQSSGTLSDEGQATLLATIGTDAANSAKAFQDGNLARGARLENRVLDTIPPARVALGCP
jgi:hypothetical protein